MNAGGVRRNERPAHRSSHSALRLLPASVLPRDKCAGSSSDRCRRALALHSLPVFFRDGSAAEETALRFGSVCSGIEAATVAWHPLGFTPVWFAEIDPFCCALVMTIEECARGVVEVWEKMPKNASYILPADLTEQIRRLQRAIQRDERGSPIAPDAAKS